MAKGMEHNTVKQKWGSEASREDAHPIMLLALSHIMFKNIFYFVFFLRKFLHVDTLIFR